jgi:hypothetical protein
LSEPEPYTGCSASKEEEEEVGVGRISQNVKLQVYYTLRPVVTYASETWLLKEKEIN